MSKNIIIIVLVIILQAIFAAINIRNVSDISIGFKVFAEVPVFITITISFLMGALIFFPIAFVAGRNYSKSSEMKRGIKNHKKLFKEKEIHEIKTMD